MDCFEESGGCKGFGLRDFEVRRKEGESVWGDFFGDEDFGSGERGWGAVEGGDLKLLMVPW